jgi:beta-phosphoglucomutase-like phosphatase (HAD superfamily)
VRRHLRGFAEAGVDQVTFIQQGGRNRHEHICEALELFASDVMPEFKEREDEREMSKQEELAPAIERAMARKKRKRELSDDEIPVVTALGRQIVETATAEERVELEKFRDTTNVPIEDPAGKRRS